MASLVNKLIDENDSNLGEPIRQPHVYRGCVHQKLILRSEKRSAEELKSQMRLEMKLIY